MRERPVFAQCGFPLRPRRTVTSTAWSIWPDIETGKMSTPAPVPRRVARSVTPEAEQILAVGIVHGVEDGLLQLLGELVAHALGGLPGPGRQNS